MVKVDMNPLHLGAILVLVAPQQLRVYKPAKKVKVSCFPIDALRLYGLLYNRTAQCSNIL